MNSAPAPNCTAVLGTFIQPVHREKMTRTKLTVGELRRHLENWPDDMELIFSDDGLDFYRFKKRGETLLQMEFDQTISRDNEPQDG